MSKPVLIVILAFMVLVGGGFAVWYLIPSSHGQVNCGSWTHPRVPVTEFRTHYERYAVEVAGKLEGKGEGKVTVTPQLRSLSDALQQGNEYRKYVVHGYNVCAITPDQYARYGREFMQLEMLAQRISQLLAAPRTPAGERALDSLAVRYAAMTTEMQR